jgi:hypothetical protein
MDKGEIVMMFAETVDKYISIRTKLWEVYERCETEMQGGPIYPEDIKFLESSYKEDLFECEIVFISHMDLIRAGYFPRSDEIEARSKLWSYMSERYDSGKRNFIL